MLAVRGGFFIYPLIEGGNDVINSDWPAFATGARSWSAIQATFTTSKQATRSSSR